MSLYQRVFYITPGEPIEVPAQASIPVTPWQATLCSPPMSFAFNEYAGPGRFTADREGLLALVGFDGATGYSNGGYKIITKADGTMTPLPFFQAMSALIVYGLRDEGLTIAQQINMLRMRKVALRCGFASALTASVAASVGIQTRTVQLFSLDPLNYVDDGHVTLEANVGGKWTLFDVPNDIAFQDSAGSLMSLGGVISAGVGNCNVVTLARHESYQQDYPNNSGQPPLDVLREYLLATENRQAAWRAHMYQVPGISGGDGKMYWGVKPEQWGQKSQVESYQPGWVAMPFADWAAKFYPNGL